MPCAQTCLSLSRSIKSGGHVKALAITVKRENTMLGTVATRSFLSRYAALAVIEGHKKLLKQ
jgi:hypothetical protein